jgi:STAM-binding protein
MSQHQLSQGYRPSVQPGYGPQDAHAHQQPIPYSSSSPQGGIQYPSNPLPQPPMPSPYQSYVTPAPSSHPPRPQATPSLDSIPRTERVSDRADPNAPHELKTVTLPRECLQRFLSIAAVNTARNRETCGLLLGKDRGSKYVVTTLLIPKQRSTSDTCAMEEEELVLQFTEERSLITLGWIHTHPTQSCFMSSVDLHTHCGFQRMLPESFAVVCAPQHTPK